MYSSVFQVVSFPQVSPLKPCTHISPIRATCPAHLSFLVSIIWMTFESPSAVIHINRFFRSFTISSTGNHKIKHVRMQTQGHYFIWQVVQLHHSVRFLRPQAAQCFAVRRGLHVLVQCIAVSITFSLTTSEESAKYRAHFLSACW